MVRRCPSCKGHNARRSKIRGTEVTARRLFFSPYRCRDCQTRFWVISRNTYQFAALIGVAIAAGVIGWNAGSRNQPPPIDAVEVAAEEQVVADLYELAEKNDASAEYELAQRYATGVGVPKDAADAAKWLERSAQHGNAQAQLELGVALRDGRDMIQDFEASRKWFELAAEGGNGQAQLELGIMYRAGSGIPVDYLRAYAWLNVAAAQGVPGAASARDVVRTRLSPEELQQAQALARRMRESYSPKAAPAQ